jgi:hypothetical protein
VSPLAFIKGFALAGVVALGFALGLAWEHRGPTPKAFAWIAGQSLRAQRDALQASVDAPGYGWRARFDTCHTNVSALSGSIKGQSDAVAAMRAEGDAMTAVSVKAVRGAAQAATRAAAVAEEIAGRSPASPDLCASADQLILDYAPQ